MLGVQQDRGRMVSGFGCGIKVAVGLGNDFMESASNKVTTQIDLLSFMHILFFSFWEVDNTMEPLANLMVLNGVYTLGGYSQISFFINLHFLYLWH